MRWIVLVASLAVSSLITAGYQQMARAQAVEEFESVQVEAVSNAATAAEAARQASAKAVSDLSRARVIEIIGDKKYQKNKVLIENKILRNSAKFIPIVNHAPPVRSGEVFKVQVDMKLSNASLRQLLLDAGLMYETDGPASLLPLVVFQDRVNATSYRWWVNQEPDDKQKFLVQLHRMLNQALYSELAAGGFYLARQQSFGAAALFPPALRVERLGTEELGFVSRYFKTPLIIRGDVRLRESRETSGGAQANIRLDVYHAGNGRTIAEVVRNYETEPGQFELVLRNRLANEFQELSKDLTVQLTEAWQRGTLGTNVLVLAVRGRFSPQELTDFKAQISKSIREVKSIKERLFEPGQITFEVDITGGAQLFADKLKKIEINGVGPQVMDSDGRRLVVDIRPPGATRAENRDRQRR